MISVVKKGTKNSKSTNSKKQAQCCAKVSNITAGCHD